MSFLTNIGILLCDFQRFPPFSLLLSRCSTLCLFALPRTPPLVVPGLSDRRLVRVVSATLTPLSLTSCLCLSSCFRAFSFLGLFLLRCLISLTADWSGLSALPPPPAPQSPRLVWSLERSSGLSDRRLVRIVRLPPLNKQQLSNRWGLKTACVRFF